MPLYPKWCIIRIHLQIIDWRTWPARDQHLSNIQLWQACDPSVWHRQGWDPWHHSVWLPGCGFLCGEDRGLSHVHEGQWSLGDVSLVEWEKWAGKNLGMTPDTRLWGEVRHGVWKRDKWSLRPNWWPWKMYVCVWGGLVWRVREHTLHTGIEEKEFSLKITCNLHSSNI